MAGTNKNKRIVIIDNLINFVNLYILMSQHKLCRSLRSYITTHSECLKETLKAYIIFIINSCNNFILDNQNYT